MSSLDPVICPLVPGFQRYAWGKLASDATGTVAAMYLANSAGAVADPSTPFAETWMGTHPTCPSQVLAGGQEGATVKLNEFLKQKGEALSAANMRVEEYSGELSYLFKVTVSRLHNYHRCLRTVRLHHFCRRFSPSAMLSASSRIPPNSAPRISTTRSPSSIKTPTTNLSWRSPWRPP